MRKSFADNLKELINVHSLENGSNTPDYILCNFITGCLKEFDAAVRARDSHNNGAEYTRDAEHPDYPFCDWNVAAASGDTVLGYNDWVCHSIERDEPS